MDYGPAIFDVSNRFLYVPIRVAFAMTINKSQGQTLDMVGICLREPVFAHGQLYVAFSRVTARASVIVKILESPTQGRLKKGSDATFTRNIVYKEILHYWIYPLIRETSPQWPEVHSGLSSIFFFICIRYFSREFIFKLHALPPVSCFCVCKIFIIYTVIVGCIVCFLTKKFYITEDRPLSTD